MSFSDQRSADWYDAIHKSKDYAGESAVVIRLLDDDYHCSLIEYGCGTGRYLDEFKRIGWSVKGVEPSIPMMTKARERGHTVEGGFICVPRNFKSQNAVALYNVIGYAVARDTLVRVLQCVNESLSGGGVFVFDFLNTVAAASKLRVAESATAEKDGYQLHRTTFKSFDGLSCLLKYDMHYAVLQCGAQCDSWREEHRVRCFTVPEVEQAVLAAGMTPTFHSWRGGKPEGDEFYVLCRASK